MAHPAVAVLEYNLVGYRRYWLSSVLGALAIPLVLLLGIGVALGSYIDRDSSLPVSYLEYLAPGLLASGALQLAVTEAGAPVLSRFKWQRTYFGIGTAPPRPVDMILGELAFLAIRVLITATAFGLVMLALGAARSGWVGLTPLLAVLLGLAAAAPMMAFSATVNSANGMTVMLRFGMLPMTLFSGVFFPVEQLPGALQPLAQALPLWHGVELCRAAAQGIGTAWPAAAHLGGLGLWFVVGLALARHRFRRRLTV